MPVHPLFSKELRNLVASFFGGLRILKERQIGGQPDRAGASNSKIVQLNKA